MATPIRPGDQETEGPDLEAKSFTLQDLRWAQREGYQQGAEAVLLLIDAGATTEYVRSNLFDRPKP